MYPPYYAHSEYLSLSCSSVRLEFQPLEDMMIFTGLLTQDLIIVQINGLHISLKKWKDKHKFFSPAVSLFRR